MTRTISATEARVHFGQVLDEVQKPGARVVVERAGKPIAAIVSIEELRSFGERKSDVEALIERAHRNGESISARRGGEPLPDFADVLQKLREERDADLLNNLL